MSCSAACKRNQHTQKVHTEPPFLHLMDVTPKRYFSWAAIQKSVASTTAKAMQFDPTLLVAISGGGLIPARLVRTFIKSAKYCNVPIQVSMDKPMHGPCGSSTQNLTTACPALDDVDGLMIPLFCLSDSQTIALSLYDDNDVMGTQVTRSQWMAPEFDLSGHSVLLVDEVDDSRKTLAFACQVVTRKNQLSVWYQNRLHS